MRTYFETVSLRIPDNITFAELQLKREPDGQVSFDLDVIKAICRSNDIDPQLFEGSIHNVVALIVNWYFNHRKRDGSRDPVVEALIAEVDAEVAAEMAQGHAPGHA